jgi:hypothetical protein
VAVVAVVALVMTVLLLLLLTLDTVAPCILLCFFDLRQQCRCVHELQLHRSRTVGGGSGTNGEEEEGGGEGGDVGAIVLV